MEEENKSKKTNYLLIAVVVLVLIIGFEAYTIATKAKNDYHSGDNNTNTNKVEEKEKEQEQVVENTKEEEDTPTEKESNDNEYASVFKEDDNTIIDYNISTDKDEINFKKAYELVIKESSSLKKKKDINLFNYVGKVNIIGGYYYINYDVNFYNLPKDVYDKNKEQIEKDKTNGYKNISKYLVKKAFYYYIFDGTKKVQTREVINDKLITDAIPNDWVKLGKYKNSNEYCMYEDVLLMLDESHKYNNYLVVYDTGKEVKIKYLGKSKTIISSKEYKSRIDELYNRKLSYDYSEYTKYYCFLDTCSSKEIDLKSYYEFEKNESQELKIVDGYSYADTVFEVVNGELHVKRVGYDDVYNLANIKSLKVAFNVAFGYDVYLLDNSNTLHYTSFSKDYDTNKGIFDKYNNYKNGIVSEKVNNYAIYESCNCITCSFELDYNK